jgi:hypothetical protein
MTAPELSVVCVTPHDFTQIRKTVRHLREQEDAARVELLIVCTSEDAVDDVGPDELTGFAAVRRIAVGPIANVDHASASGIRAASAPVVAVIEDHAFVGPGWVGALLTAHQQPVAAVTSLMENANPRHGLSWMNLALAYGAWTDPARGGRAHSCAGHNFSAKTALLQATGDDLEGLLGRGGSLFSDLASSGQPLWLEPGARIAHVNPSTLRSSARLRFDAGRLYGATRAADGGWGPARQLLYVLLGWLIPVVRYPRLRAELLRSHPFDRVGRRLLPALLVGLACDAAGQVAGYARGPGESLGRLAVFEMDRLQHLTRRDRRALLRSRDSGPHVLGAA